MPSVQRLTRLLFAWVILVLGAGAALAQPTFSKVFAPDTIGPDAITTLTYSITNSDPTPVSSLAFTDTLPTRFDPMRIAPGFASTDCPDASLTAVAGTQTVALTNARLAPGSSCTITVNIEAGDVSDVFTSTSGDLTSSAGNSGSATASLTVDATLASFSKSLSPSTIAINGSTTLTYTIDNSASANAIGSFFGAIYFGSGATLNETLPTGLTLAANPNLQASAGCQPGFFDNSSGSTIQVSSIGITAGNICTISMDVRATSAGVFDLLSGNLAANVGGSFGRSFATLTVTGLSTAAPQLQKFFVPDTVNPGGTATLEFFLSNGNRDFAATDLSFTDDLDAMLTGATLVASSIPTDPCGPGSTITGTDEITFSDGMLGTGSNCSFSVQVAIPATAVGNTYTNTTSALTAMMNGSSVTGSTATDTLTVRTATVPQPVFTKEFTDDPATPGDQITVRYTIDNGASAAVVTDLAFEDELDFLATSSSFVGGSGANLCGAGSVVGTTVSNSAFNSFPPTITLTSGSIAAGATCTFDVVIQTDATQTPGTYPSTSGALSYNDGTSVVTGGTASDDFVFGGGANISFTKEFDVPSALGGQTVALTFTITSAAESLSTATALAFSDDLAAFLTGSTANLVTTDTCGGTPAGVGTGNFSYSGGTLAPGNSCEITVDVILGAANNTDNTNTASALTGTAGGEPVTAPGPSASLYVGNTLPYTVEMSFPGGSALPGETITVDFDLTNPNGATAVTTLSGTVSFAAALPNMDLTTLPAAGFCGAGSVASEPAPGFLLINGLEIAAGGSCSFSAELLVPTTSGDGTYSPSLSTTGTVGAQTFSISARADLTVDSTVLEMTKTFADAIVTAGDTTDVSFTITNTADVAVTSLGLTDDLDAFLTGTTLVSATNACGTISGTGTGTLTLSNGALASGNSCTFTATLQTVSSAPAGDATNTAGPVTADIGGVTVYGIAASDSITVSPDVDLTFTKSFADLGIPAGGNTVMTIVIDNTSVSATATGTSFSDDLDAMLLGLTASAHSASAGCGGGVFSGASFVTFSGGDIAAGDTCTLTATVTAPGGAAPGSYTNTTSQLSLSGIAAEPAATASLAIVPPPSFAKAFTDAAFPEGGTNTITFTIDNSGSVVAATSLDFTNTLSAGFTVATVPAASTTCTGGTLTAVAGAGSVSYTGGTVAAGASCTVTVNVTATTAGSDTNTSGALTSNLGNSGTATGTVTVVAAPSFSKAFSPQFVPLGFVSTLTFTIDNTTSILAATSLDFSDTMPANVTLATPANGATTCTGGTLTAVNGAGTLSYSGGTVAAGASCTVQVDVINTATGSHVNTSGDLTSSLGNSGTASATLNVMAPPTFAKAFASSTAIVGASTTLTFTINNSSPLVVNAIDFTDTLPVGMVVATTPNASTTCTGGTLTATAGTGVISYTGGNNGPYLSCTVSADVTTAAAGDFVNTSGALTTSMGNSGTATDTLRVNPAPTFTKSFGASPIGVGLTTTVSFAINNTGSTVAATALDFTDTLPVGMIVATPANATSACTGGTLTATDGAGSISYTGGTIAAGASCVISVDVTTTATGSLVNTSGALTSALGNSGTAAATLVAVPQPGFTKLFSPDSISLGQSSTLTFTIDNTGSVLGATALGFTDGLPTDLVVATPANASTTCTGGTVTATAGASTVSYAAGTVAASASCTLSVDVTPASAGTFPNTSGALTSSLGTSGTATDTLTVLTPEIGISGSLGGAVADGGTLAQGTLNAGTQQSLVLTISNTGTEALTLNAAPVISAQTNVVVDSVVGPLLTSVPVAGSTTITILYTPAAAIQNDPTVTQGFSFDFALGNSDVDEPVYDIAISGTAQDATAPTGYSVSFDQDPVNIANQTAASFTFAAAEVGTDYAYSITSSGGGAAVTGSGTIATATDQIAGLDLSGLGDGTLTLSVTLTDAATNAGAAVTDTTTKDATAPAGYTVSFDQGSVNAANQTAMSFSFAGAEVGADYTYTIISDAGGAPVTNTGTIVTMTDVISGLDLSGLGDGTLTLTVSLTDPAGNTGSDATDTIAKDTVAPSIAITTPVSGDGLISNAEAGTVVLSGTTTGLLDGAVVTVVVNDGAAGSVTDTTTVTTGAWSLTLNLSTLTDAVLSLTADASDAAGNPAPQATAAATLDTTAPAGYAVAFDQDPVNIANETAIDFTVTGAEIGAVINLQVSSSGGATIVTVPGVTATTASVAIPGIDLSSLADGTLTVTATQTDPAGNTGAGVTDTATKDTVAPSLTIDTPIAGDDVINAGEAPVVAVTGTSTDLADGTVVTVTVTDGAAGLATGTATVNAGIWSLTLDVSALADGTLTFAANASDAAANPAPEVTQTATKDAGIPTVTIDTPVAGDDLINAAEAPSFTVTGTTTGVADGTTVLLEVFDAANTSVGTFSTTATGDVWSFVFDVTALADGDYTLTADVSDAAGNAAPQASAPVTIDTLAPSVAIADPAPGVANAFYVNAVNAAEAAAFAASGTALDAADAVQVVLTATDGAAGSVSVTTGLTAGPAPAHSWADALDLSSLGDGTITLTAVITDVAGNASSTSTTFLKDTTAPAGYTATLDQDPVNIANETAASFTFAGAEVGPGVAGTDVTFAYSISSDGGGVPVTGTGTIVTATDQVTGIDLSSLPDGTLTLSVTLTDFKGNTGTAATDTATKDATAPSLAFDAPLFGDDVVNGAEAPVAVVSGTSTDLLDGAIVTVVVGDGAAGSVTGTATVASGIWSVTMDLSTLAEGALTLTADASDAAGNPAPQVTAAASKDTVAPTGYAASLDNDPVNLSNQGATGFTLAGAEVGATFTYTITSDGGGADVTGSGTIATATDQITGLDFGGLGDGTLTLTVALTDPAGNTGADATDTATKDAIGPSATLVGPAAAQSDPFTVTLTFSEPVTGLALTSVSLVNGTASALTGSGDSYSFTVTPDHDGPVEIALDAAAAIDAATNPSLAAAAITVTADLTGTPNPAPLPDADGDGVADILETGDRDGDGILDAQDFDPQGYFYCEDDGRIIPGGSFTVTGPSGSNGALGTLNDINITRNGSTGEYQWFALRPGSYSMSLTYPTAVGIPSTARPVSATLDLTTLLPASPASIGSSEFGSTGFLADASLAANPAFHTSFDIEAGDPFVLGNNIPMTQCADNPVTLTAATNGAEANGGAPTDPTFTVTMGRISTQATVIAYSVTGTATSGTDFTALSGSVTIPAGALSATITVPVLEDPTIEGSETVILTLTGVTTGDLTTGLGTLLTQTATITDDDFAGIVVTNVDLITNEGGGDDASMTFLLSGAPSAPVTLSFAGDAQCRVTPATLTFDATNSTVAQTLTIRAIDDDKVEGTHSCQPTVVVGSADARFDALPLALATVTVTDDLVDQIREPLTEILENDLAETITTQTKAFSRIAKGALQRLQAGRDLPCGEVAGFDVDGSVDILNSNGTARGTFGSDTYNCVTDTREILDGTFSLNKTEDTGVQALLQFAWQRERFVTDEEIAGYFLGGYYSRTDVSGLGDGSINGFGVNGGFYGARAFAEGLFMDYYVAGAAGRHKFDIDFDAATAPINATGQYNYLAGFAGVGLSGQHDFGSFVMKPRVGIDFAYAKAGDADVTARQLGLTHTGIIALDDFSGTRATAEIRFESLASPGGAEAMADMMRTSITPRFTCELSSYEDDTNCGVGLALAWERMDAASGLIWGFEVDAEKIDDTRRFTFNIKREKPIANGLGSVVTRLSMPAAQSVQLEHGIKLDW